MLNKGNIPDDWLIRELNSDAAQTLLSSGFSQADVEKAIFHVRERYGNYILILLTAIYKLGI